MPKHLYLSIAIFILAFSTLSAQSKLNFGLKLSGLTGRSTLVSKNVNILDKGSSVDGVNTQMAVWFNLPIHKYIRLGAEAGFLDLKTYMDYELRFSGASGFRTIKAYHQFNQVYFAIVPEFRIRKFAYVNAGIACTSDFQNRFTRGDIYDQPGFLEQELDDYTYPRENPFGYFFGLGLCPKLHGDLALLLDLRYRIYPTESRAQDRIYTQNKGFVLGFGLMYRPD